MESVEEPRWPASSLGEGFAFDGDVEAARSFLAMLARGQPGRAAELRDLLIQSITHGLALARGTEAEALMRQLHALKGTLATANMRVVVAAIEAIEERVPDLTEGQREAEATRVSAWIVALVKRLQEPI